MARDHGWHSIMRDCQTRCHSVEDIQVNEETVPKNYKDLHVTHPTKLAHFLSTISFITDSDLFVKRCIIVIQMCHTNKLLPCSHL